MVDILMATYNGEKYIGEQINSILEQSYGNWKLIIHDDGSEDNTVEIIKSFEQKYPEKIILLEDEIKKQGAKKNFFYLIKKSHNPYIMFADQDDIWKKDKVYSAVKKIKIMEKKYPGIPLLLHGDLQVVDSTLNTIALSLFKMQKLEKNKNGFNDILVQNNATGCTMICNRMLADMCTEMPDNSIMHDWWLALIASAFGKLIYMGDAGILYRQHEKNTEGAKNVKSIKYIINKFANMSDIKKVLKLTYMQAESFKKLYGDMLSEEKREVLEAYIKMSNTSKIEKYRIIYKYGFMKSGFERKIGYMLLV